MNPQLRPPTGRHLGPVSSVPHLRAGRGATKSQSGYQLLKPEKSWQGAEEVWSRLTTAEEAAALWPGRWTGLGGEAASPSPSPLLQSTGSFRRRSQSQELGDASGGDHRLKPRKADFHPLVSHRQEGWQRERRRGEASFLTVSEGERRERARRDLWKRGPILGRLPWW